MARGPRPRGPRDNDEQERERRRDHEREKASDDPLRHAHIIRRRWLGSPPPTAERYAHALRQWQRLAGAVVRPAASLTVEPPAPSGSGEDEK
jgi:hypothetical protein